MTSVLTQQTQISDFFGSYPQIDINTPTNMSIFNTLIARKAEFNELQSTSGEPIPARGEGFSHQKFAVRYLTWYDRLMLLHDPGTGKSCIITHSAELFKNSYLKDPDDPTQIRRAVILLHGPALEENIKHEIVCKCTDRIYETEKVLQAASETVMKSNLTRELNTWYEITTYEKFAKEIRKFEREEDLEEYMSNKAFYIDEAQNVPSLQDKKRTTPSPTTIAEARELMEQLTTEYRARETQRGRIAEERFKGETIYQTIWRAFHKGKRSKIVLATATPMTNTPNDIIPLINLILPLENQMPMISPEPVSQQDEFVNQGLDFFEPYFRGRVSYVRSAATGAVEQPMGDIIPEFYTRIYLCYMSIFQYEAYLKASYNAPSINSAQETRESFYRNSRYASNFVFPDGTYGMEAFNKYVENIGDTYQFRNTPEGRECRQLVANDQGLQYLSAKYYNIINISRESYPHSLPVVDDNLGIVFVYFPDYVHGSGAVVLSLCYKEHGYEEFRETRNIFIGSQQKNLGRSFGPCAKAEQAEGEREARIPKRKRYAILTSNTPKARIPTILNTLSSYENRYGEYLQVLIGSETAREGINITNAVKMIMASSSWNHASNTQAKDRVFRTNSLISRIAEKKERFRAQGLPTDNVTIEIKTYNMASVYGGLTEEDFVEENQARAADNIQPLDPIFIQSNTDTIDPKMYVRAEEKDRLIRRVIRYMKQSAVDCFLNYDRNVRTTDRDGSPDCDYLPCQYSCAGIRREMLRPLDRTTKILYYSSEEVAEAVQILKKIFSRFHSLRIEQLHRMANQVDPELETIFVDMAIEQMINENTRVLNRMGFFSYLRESENGVIYLEKDPFEIRPHPESTAYSSVLIGTQDVHSNTFIDYVTEINIISEVPLIEELVTTPINTPEFADKLNQLSIASKVTLLEKILYNKARTGETNDFYDAILSAFSYSVFETPEPINELRDTAIKLSNRGKTRGRKPNPNSQPNIKKFTFEGGFSLPRADPGMQSNTVILHTLYNQAANERTSYGAITRYRKAEGKIRIFKISEGVGWRDVEAHEHIVYNHLIQGRINQIRQYYEQFPIYGIMLPPNNQFHIRDRENENTIAEDGRTVYDGRVCNTWKKPDLIDILYRLNVRLPQNLPPTLTREQIINTLQAKVQTINWNLFDNDKLVHFYLWYNANISRDGLCKIIKDNLEQTGRLLTGKLPTRSDQIPTYSMATGPTSGSIRVAADLTTVDYSQAFNMSSASPPQIPSQVLPQFAASAGQSVGAVNQIQQIPTAQMYNIPQSTAQISQPPPQYNEIQVQASMDLSSNVGPAQAIGQ